MTRRCRRAAGPPPWPGSRAPRARRCGASPAPDLLIAARGAGRCARWAGFLDAAWGPAWPWPTRVLDLDDPAALPVPGAREAPLAWRRPVGTAAATAGRRPAVPAPRRRAARARRAGPRPRRRRLGLPRRPRRAPVPAAGGGGGAARAVRGPRPRPPRRPGRGGAAARRDGGRDRGDPARRVRPPAPGGRGGAPAPGGAPGGARARRGDRDGPRDAGPLVGADRRRGGRLARRRGGRAGARRGGGAASCCGPSNTPSGPTPC